MSEPQLLTGTWILVTDGEKALFLRNKGDAVYPDFEVIRKTTDDNPSTHEQGTDRPGRYKDGANVHHSGFAETDWHRLEKDRFAKQISERLYKSAHRGDYERIVLVAPPHVLGEMRKELHKEVESRVVAEIPKELTNHTVVEIEKIVSGGRSAFGNEATSPS